MAQTGVILIVAGAVLALAGLMVWALGRAGFHGLPGDIRLSFGGVRVYLPVGTCLLLSALLSAALWVGRRLPDR